MHAKGHVGHWESPGSSAGNKLEAAACWPPSAAHTPPLPATVLQLRCACCLELLPCTLSPLVAIHGCLQHRGGVHFPQLGTVHVDDGMGRVGKRAAGQQPRRNGITCSPWHQASAGFDEQGWALRCSQCPQHVQRGA